MVNNLGLTPERRLNKGEFEFIARGHLPPLSVSRLVKNSEWSNADKLWEIFNYREEIFNFPYDECAFTLAFRIIYLRASHIVLSMLSKHWIWSENLISIDMIINSFLDGIDQCKKSHCDGTNYVIHKSSMRPNSYVALKVIKILEFHKTYLLKLKNQDTLDRLMKVLVDSRDIYYISEVGIRYRCGLIKDWGARLSAEILKIPTFYGYTPKAIYQLMQFVSEVTPAIDLPKYVKLLNTLNFGIIGNVTFNYDGTWEKIVFYTPTQSRELIYRPAESRLKSDAYDQFFELVTDAANSVELNDFTFAEICYSQAIAMEKGNKMCHFGRGLVRMKLGKYRLARKDFNIYRNASVGIGGDFWS